MLYIHTLHNLTPKTADVESVYLIRDIKDKTPYPLKEERMANYFAQFVLKDEEEKVMKNSLELVEPTLAKVRTLITKKDELHESVNLQRTEQILSDVTAPINKNLEYFNEIFIWQQNFIQEMSLIFNSLPKLRTREEKVAGNDKLNVLFQRVLRNDRFGFNGFDIVNERQVEEFKALHESMLKGYLFHYSLEEELRKASFADIKSRISEDRLKEVEEIYRDILEIQKGINVAYEANMRMVNLALVMYAYVKWLNSVV
ncbi:hypothetical protein HYX11_05565 [Candidatus Woesearchaeota archaeon]|nr:hypothetical protein [Candidatus Woesearchaeota archaeon]